MILLPRNHFVTKNKGGFIPFSVSKSVVLGGWILYAVTNVTWLR